MFAVVVPLVLMLMTMQHPRAAASRPHAWATTFPVAISTIVFPGQVNLCMRARLSVPACYDTHTHTAIGAAPDCKAAPIVSPLDPRPDFWAIILDFMITFHVGR